MVLKLHATFSHLPKSASVHSLRASSTWLANQGRTQGLEYFENLVQIVENSF